jgi:hypothetical protein
MSKRHYFFLLDHMVVGLKPDFRESVTETTLECGLKPHADDMEVIDLALRRHAILVTVDVKIIQKCKDYQDHSARGLSVRTVGASRRHLNPEENLGGVESWHETNAPFAIRPSANMGGRPR